MHMYVCGMGNLMYVCMYVCTVCVYICMYGVCVCMYEWMDGCTYYLTPRQVCACSYVLLVCPSKLKPSKACCKGLSGCSFCAERGD